MLTKKFNVDKVSLMSLKCHDLMPFNKKIKTKIKAVFSLL